jgi:DMSO reductase anchor subunit
MTAVATPAPEAISADGGIRSYHGQPVLKEPIWSWEIPDYFFAGGMAGASAGLAFCSGLRGNDVLARRAWTVAFAGIAVSPPLLISDLGKPARFFNMLRMFKVTSPMSVGSWVLAGYVPLAGIAAASAVTARVPRIGAAATGGAALLGPVVASYTAALFADTAVPVWHEARGMLPFVFGSGAALSAGAAAVACTPVASAAPARRLALAATVAELGTIEVMQRQLGELGEPYRDGAAGRLRRLSQACIAGGAALLASRGRSSRGAAVASGALLCAGVLSARWSVFKAGVQSAADPKYVIGPQRAGIERGERRGGARR